MTKPKSAPRVNDPASLIETMQVASLIPNPDNPRTHSDSQIDQIVASIREWGWTNPILVDESRNVIAGHGRLLAAQRMGLSVVPCVVARGWTPEQIAAYTIADNQLALNAGWDIDLLTMQVDALEAVGFPVELLGLEASPPERELQRPEAFTEHDITIETAHSCPSCGYRWSGPTKSSAKAGDDD